MHSPHSESFNYPDIGCLTFDATEMGHTERETCMLIIPAHTHMDCHLSQFMQYHLPYFVSFLCLPLPLFLMSAFYMYVCILFVFVLQDRLPLAVVGSNTIIEVNGKRVRGRQYPWGVAEGKG